MTPRASVDRVESAVLAAGGTFRQRGANVFRSNGVCHGGQRSESLIFTYEPDPGRVRVHCFAQCGYEQILDALGLAKGDLYDEPKTRSGECRMPAARPALPPPPEPVIFQSAPHGWRPLPDTWMPCGHPKTAEYLYATEDARVAFGVCRCEAKDFAQWRPDPNARGGRRWGIREHDTHGHLTATVPAIPYRLPQLLAGMEREQNVWIAEGEKDVLALAGIGLVATCNAEGAGKWTDAHSAYLKGADVIVVADRDVPGRKHAEKVVASLMDVARSIEVVVARSGKDAADHIAAGHRSWEFDTIWEPKLFTLDGIAL